MAVYTLLSPSADIRFRASSPFPQVKLDSTDDGLLPFFFLFHGARRMRPFFLGGLIEYADGSPPPPPFPDTGKDGSA